MCVGVEITKGAVGVYDSKALDGPVLVFSMAEWSAFVRRVRAGAFGVTADAR